MVYLTILKFDKVVSHAIIIILQLSVIELRCSEISLKHNVFRTFRGHSHLV